MTPEQIKTILDKHAKWLRREDGGERADLRGAYLQDADLQRADLRGAYLRGAYLQGADLQGADLRGAYLRGANLRDANLYCAYLRGAYLRGANLRDANLYGAYLRGAYLQGADLRDAKVSASHTWRSFMAALPDFFTGGGRKIEEVVTRDHLTCHDWTNCPTAAAYGAKGHDEVPDERREYAKLFIRLFDDGTISPEQIAEACGVTLDEVTS